MKTLVASLLVCILCCSSLIANAQDGGIVGNGQMVTQQRTIGSFHKLTVRVGMRVRIAAGNASQAELEGESNVLPHVVTQVKNGELTVMLNENTHFKNTKGVTVTIHVPQLDQIIVSTGCSVNSDRPILATNLTATVETGSSLTAPVTAKSLKLTVREGSKASLQGTVADATIRMSGAGKLDADKLTIERADIKIDGASQANVHVTKTLAATADGVSSITYSGNPAVTTKEATGLSKIRQRS
ncbi:head GIN domain-containing protein [Spirosoma sp. SC4-14]|uniref:head GIN domain-containing protein n=1 Tax=Spirosoma sp. SC4-14 TaxID=3128900 RepID=UPI0030D11CDE